jgi:hypothetical protein
MAITQPPEDNPATSGRSTWEGSDVILSEIDWLMKTQRIPEGVQCRLPAGEVVLKPLEGEIVVFVTHFEHGFGLPTSGFFRDFLDFYGLQPHHMTANAAVILAAFAALYEGYAGIHPFVYAWAKYFQHRKQSV